MEFIKVIFFALGSFFGVSESQLASEKTIVRIDPVQQTIEIQQENLFSILKNQSDINNVRTELAQFKTEAYQKWIAELDGFKQKSCSLELDANQKLISKIRLEYNDSEDLSTFGFYANTKVITFPAIPSWNIETKDGKELSGFLHFPLDQVFEFTIEPYKGMPNDYKQYKKELGDIWAQAF